MSDHEIRPEDLTRHGALLGRLARGLVHDVHAAEDAVQETYLRALEQPPAGPRSLRAWLVRVLHSRVTDGQRARGRRREETLDADATPGSEGAIEARLALEGSLIDAVRRLEEPYRQVVFLRYFEGRPPREIARRLDLPVKTVKTRLHRALALLRTRVGEDTGFDERGLVLALLPLVPLGAVPLGVPLAGSTATGGATATAFTGIGGALMIKKLALVVIVLALAFGAWRLTDRSAPPRAPSAGPAVAVPPVELERTATSESLAPLAVPEPEQRRAKSVSAAEVAAATTGELAVRCVWSDGDPADGLHVVLEHMGDRRHGLGVQRLVADHDGRLLVRDLAPGALRLRSDRGRWGRARIVAGERSELLFEQHAGVDVSGIVVDPHGRPVAGAEVGIAGWGLDWLSSFVVTRADTEGRFFVRAVGKQDSLCAFAAGMGPSALEDLDTRDVSQGHVELRLVLTAAGGDLRGQVFDLSGAPAAGARVAAGDSPDEWETRRDGTQVEARTARIAITDDAGRFALFGLASGIQPVTVLMEGLPQWSGEVEIEAGREHSLEVQLEQGVTVSGVVRDAQGNPQADAFVLALPEPFVDPFPGQGITDRGRPFPHPGFRTDADGRFELPPVPAGAIHLYASKGETMWGPPDVELPFQGNTQETFQRAAGEELVWEPVLYLGHLIAGRVLYADGTPMQDVFVSATAEEGEGRWAASTDERGHFALAGLADASYRVAVQLWNAPQEARPLERKGVWPSGGLLELRADFSRDVNRRGRVRVSVVDEGERVRGVPSVVFARENSWFYTDREGDGFTTTLEPGRYRPMILDGDREVGAGEWFDLGPSEDLDLGEVRTQPAGSLVLHLVRDHVTPGPLMIRVHPWDTHPRDPETLGPDESTFTVEGLTQGQVLLDIDGPGVAREERHPFEVTAGEPTHAEVVLRPGVHRAFLIQPAAEDWRSAHVVVRDEEGEVVFEHTWHESRRLELPFRMGVNLPLGRFTLEVATADGLSARREIHVERLEELEPELVELR